MHSSATNTRIHLLPTGTSSAAPNVTFSAVIDADVAAGKNAKSGGSNAESLLWLKRAMEFIMLLLSKIWWACARACMRGV